MNLRLKMAILQKFRTQQEFSLAAGIGETMISKFVRGFKIPSEAQKEAMAKALNMPVEELFEPKEAINEYHPG